MKSLSLVGLGLDLMGAVLLFVSSLKQRSTWLRSQFNEYDRAQCRWYELVAIEISRRLFGSRNLMGANAESVQEVVTSMFWALLFLVLGFSFQILGVIF